MNPVDLTELRSAPREATKFDLMAIAPGRTISEKLANVQEAERQNRLGLPMVSSGIVQQIDAVVPVITKQSRFEVSAGCIEDPSTLKGKQITLVISDLHIPRHRLDLLRYIASKWEGARLIIAGDVMNYENFAAWERQPRKIARHPEVNQSPVDQLAEAARDLKEFCSHFSDTVIIRGNHDDWLARSMAKIGSFGAEMADKIFVDTFRDIPNCRVAGANVRDFYVLKRGDTWIGHWNTYGKPCNKGAENAVNYMMQNPEFNLMGEFNALIQAHTHRVCMNSNYLGKWCAESGCLTQRPDYPDAKPGKCAGPNIGFAYFTQEDGFINIEESGVVPIPTIFQVCERNLDGSIGKSINENYANLIQR